MEKLERELLKLVELLAFAETPYKFLLTYNHFKDSQKKIIRISLSKDWDAFKERNSLTLMAMKIFSIEYLVFFNKLKRIFSDLETFWYREMSYDDFVKMSEDNDQLLFKLMKMKEHDFNEKFLGAF